NTVTLRNSRRQEAWRHATVAAWTPKRRGVERVSVQDDVLHAAQESVARIGQVPGELRHPRAVRLRRDPGDLHHASLQLYDEEDDVADQAVQRQHLDGEEVGRREAVPMHGEEGFPGCLRAALRCR